MPRAGSLCRFVCPQCQLEVVNGGTWHKSQLLMAYGNWVLVFLNQRCACSPPPKISSIYAGAATKPSAFTCLTAMDIQVCEPKGGPYSHINSQNPGCVLRPSPQSRGNGPGGWRAAGHSSPGRSITGHMLPTMGFLVFPGFVHCNKM